MSDTETSTRLWFFRGAAGGIMLFAAANALSWFYLSDGWSDLLGSTQNEVTEAVGFPFEIWREGESYGRGWVINFPVAGLNVLLGLTFLFGCGWLATRFSRQLEPLLEMPENPDRESRKRLATFSVRGLLIATTFAALFFGTVQTLGASSRLLTAIYLAGPAVLILVAMAPVGMPWQHRVVVLILFAIFMLGGSIFVGSKLGMEFDRVLMGVYICWVPQSVIATVAVLAWTFATKTQNITEPAT